MVTAEIAAPIPASAAFARAPKIFFKKTWHTRPPARDFYGGWPATRTGRDTRSEPITNPKPECGIWGIKGSQEMKKLLKSWKRKYSRDDRRFVRPWLEALEERIEPAPVWQLFPST